MTKHLVTALGLGFVLFAFAACERDVENEKMEEIAKWSSAACLCAKQAGATAASCKSSTPEPAEVSQVGDNGKPQYKLESYQNYSQLRIIGEECIRKAGQ